MRNIHLLGATGSIGTQVLEIIATLPDVTVQTMSIGSNITLGRKIIQSFQPKFVSVRNQEDMLILQNEFNDIAFGYGEQGLIEAAVFPGVNVAVVNAVVGMVGLKPTLAAISVGYDILLANKETLVAGGKLVMEAARKNNVKIIPIDSEHSAIFQCLQGHKLEEVDYLMITASGGSFRHLSREQLKDVTLHDALQHPNWSMGVKITIDSATMVNKGLEVIEAHYLFDMPYEKIKTVLHQESIIHSMVAYVDGSVLAQLSNPDMRLPIQYALTYPVKQPSFFKKPLDWQQIKQLHFDVVDTLRYPCLDLAYKAGIQGGIMPAIYNISNEAAVALFIDGKISFLDIEMIIGEAMESAKFNADPTLDDIITITNQVKQNIYDKYN